MAEDKIIGGCEINVRNTGKSRCVKIPGRYAMAIILPKNATYTGLDEENNPIEFAEWIMNMIHDADPIRRAYPFPDIEGVENTGEDKVEFTTPYGRKFIMAPGQFGFTMQYLPDDCLTERLVAFNNQKFGVMIADMKNDVMVVKIGNTIKGMEMTPYTSPQGANTASDVALPEIAFTATIADELNKRRWISPAGFNVSEIKGLEDITMAVIKDGMNYIIKFFLSCDNSDVTPELQTLAAGAWLQKDTSGAVTPLGTTPTYDVSKRAFTMDVASIPSGYSLGLVPPNKLYKEFGIEFKELVDFVEIP